MSGGRCVRPSPRCIPGRAVREPPPEFLHSGLGIVERWARSGGVGSAMRRYCVETAGWLLFPFPHSVPWGKVRKGCRQRFKRKRYRRGLIEGSLLVKIREMRNNPCSATTCTIAALPIACGARKRSRASSPICAGRKIGEDGYPAPPPWPSPMSNNGGGEKRQSAELRCPLPRSLIRGRVREGVQIRTMEVL